MESACYDIFVKCMKKSALYLLQPMLLCTFVSNYGIISKVDIKQSLLRAPILMSIHSAI